MFTHRDFLHSTAKYYKNGRVYGGKLQGGTVLPGSLSGICTFLSTINKKYASYSGLLEKGMHWFYTPDRLQDYEFFNATNRADSPCPFMVCAIDGSWSEEGPPEFYLTFSVNIECLGQVQGAAFAIDVPPDIYAFHCYTRNSTPLYRTPVAQSQTQFPG